MKNILHDIFTNDNIIVTRSIFTFFLIISGNYLNSLFGCGIQRLLTDNMYVKHILGFMTLYLFTTLSNIASGDNTKDNYYSFIPRLVITVLLYIWYILISKTYASYTIAIIMIFFIIFVMTTFIQDLKVDTDKEGDNDNWNFKRQVYIKRSIIALVVVNIILTIIGFIKYFKAKRIEHKKAWSWRKYFIGIPECKYDKLRQ